MPITAQDMIAARGATRTAPPAMDFDQPDTIPGGGQIAWTARGTGEVDPPLRDAAGRLRETLRLGAGDRVLSVCAGNTVLPLRTDHDLPFADGSFDAVLSNLGAMFALDHRRMAGELLRICRPGGRIGLACWTPDGFNGRLTAMVADHVALPPSQGIPVQGGTREYLDDLFGDAADALGASPATYTWRYASPTDWVAAWRAYGGPLHDAYLLLDPERRNWLTSDLLALAARFNEATDGSMAVPSEYLEFVVHKSSWRS